MKKFSLSLFLILSLNLFLAQAIYAATPDKISRAASYTIALLGLATLSVSIYLFAVIFQPEKF
ncbi:potassium-transporting ATPase subunit F [Nostoc sp. FACHB-888]|uniref:potassium-transporting ATPase subunit F n=1 Tax=Nostoc sp. FACHB-888 TaxID=2692842 RepID=UPI001683F3F7|nr:potassium-transporting ATPase subunit F [Nostoc sp. FACHB-888]MBD2242114.1 potassium-transporting ATPase subunit F [Nostoc sp. FACHB-888]MCC5652997.1 potassium-transporting ATPase subunit F [Nostoc sp. XA013]